VTAPGDTPPPPPGAAPGPGANGGAPLAGCLKVTLRGKRKLRRVGKLRLRGRCVTASSPLKLKLKPRKGARALRIVRFNVDGKKVKTVRCGGARVASTRLAAGKHRLVVRVVPRNGRARAYRLRLRVVAA
jgi:hypothetical protein